MGHWGVRLSRPLPLLAVLMAVLASACAPTRAPLSEPAPTGTPSAGSPTLTAPTPASSLIAAPTAPPYPLSMPWKVGASPLPLRADGFGQVLPTPKVLRNRRFATVDVLPPPRDGQFHSSLGPITPSLAHRMSGSYQAGCPVPLARLSYLQVSFRGFDGGAHTGELVVAATVAPAVVRIFHTLYDDSFPIEQMQLPTGADLTAAPTGDGNDTAGFVCRTARGQKRFSAHAYGLAIDVNPFQNPETKGDLVLPELASAYTHRSWVRPGMFLKGSSEVRAFTNAGWTWGGTFRSLKDYMHFSETGQ